MKLAKRFVFGWIGLCMITQCAGDNGRCAASMRGTGRCLSTWHQWNGMCYYVTQSLQWADAKQECIKMGGVMVVPQSEEETAFLKTLQSRFWIGCNDLQTEGEWECNGLMEVHETYRYWDAGQPDGTEGQGTQDCDAVWLTANGKWHDVWCNKELAAICKRPVAATLHF